MCWSPRVNVPEPFSFILLYFECKFINIALHSSLDFGIFLFTHAIQQNKITQTKNMYEKHKI